MSEPLLDAYWMVLQDTEIAEVERAVRRALESEKFMPVPAELKRLTGDLAPIDKARVVWPDVRKAAGDPYNTFRFEDPLVHAAIAMCGGWQVFVHTDGEEFDQHLRRIFENAFVSASRVDPARLQLDPCTGDFERENRRNGYDKDPRFAHMHRNIGLSPKLVRVGYKVPDELKRLTVQSQGKRLEHK